MLNKMAVNVVFGLALSHGAMVSLAQSTESAAEGQGVQSSLERIERKVDTVLDNSAEVKKNTMDSPLGDRRNGVELNLFRLLTWGEDGQKSISGTYSRFFPEKNLELAFPFMYSSGLQESYSGSATDHLESTTLDVHYRQYLGHRLDGFYISGFARAAHLSGAMEQDYGSDYFESSTTTKLGVGVGLGYRIISKSGLYWGMSFSVGKYLTGDSDIFEDSDSPSSDLDDSEMIVDIEFLKFGYVF